MHNFQWREGVIEAQQTVTGEKGSVSVVEMESGPKHCTDLGMTFSCSAVVLISYFCLSWLLLFSFLFCLPQVSLILLLLFTGFYGHYFNISSLEQMSS